MLKQDITRREQVIKALLEPEKDLEFEARSYKEYEVEVIINSTVYSQQANNQISSLYYLILWKNYLKEENICELLLIVIHFRKLINTFHKEYLKRLLATPLSLDSALPIARVTIPKEPK